MSPTSFHDRLNMWQSTTNSCKLRDSVSLLLWWRTLVRNCICKIVNYLKKSSKLLGVVANPKAYRCIKLRVAIISSQFDHLLPASVKANNQIFPIYIVLLLRFDFYLGYLGVLTIFLKVTMDKLLGWWLCWNFVFEENIQRCIKMMDKFDLSISFHVFSCFISKRIQKIEKIINNYHDVLARIRKPSIVDSPYIICIELGEFLILKFEEFDKLLKHNNNNTSIRINRNL